MAAPSLTRIAEYIPNAPSTDSGVLSNLSEAAWSLVQKYCNRFFSLGSFDEVYTGFGTRYLLLNEYPIVSISRIATCPTEVITIRNTAEGVSRATVQVTSTGVRLVSVASGVTTTTDRPFATYTTIGALATGIAAVSGWTATAYTNYGTWSSSDLRAVQGALNARSQVGLSIHVDDLGEYSVKPEIGEIYSPYGFHRLFQGYRVIYVAGYSTIPAEIEQATVEIVANAYNSRNLNSAVNSENLGGYSYAQAVQESFNNLSMTARKALQLYKSRKVARHAH